MQETEEITKYMSDKNLRCQYIHSEVDTLDRVRILQELSEGKFDVLIGVNLLREGLDLPGVSLVAILDADKEGFLRNKRSLLQMIGRAARHIRGAVYMYADKTTPSMKEAINETKRRRDLQMAHNQKHGITPQPVKKAENKLAERGVLPSTYEVNASKSTTAQEPAAHYGSKQELAKLIKQVEKKMKQASAAMDYVKAQAYKKELETLQKKHDEVT